jgi:hypothetical protein
MMIRVVWTMMSLTIGDLYEASMKEMMVRNSVFAY